MTDTPLAIIGAGLAGLTAARTAHEAGIRSLVLEASDRIGGRIDSIRGSDGQIVGDLGPTWVWPPFQPGVPRWLERLGLGTFEQYDSGEAVLDGFAERPVCQPLPGQYGMARIAAGPGSLVDAMAAELPDDAIQTGHAVNAVRHHDDGRLRIETAGREPLIAERVLIAAPLRIVAERIQLPADIGAPLQDMLRAMPTWMAAQAKAVIRYPRPFWRESGLSGRIASRLGPLFEAHDHTSLDGEAALFGFVATPPAQRGAETLRTAILDQLTRCLGPQAAAPTDVVIRDWADAPWICADADRHGPPEHPSVGPEALRTGHLDGRLWFCAAETAEQSPGLIEGALLAGEAAARAAVQGLEGDA
ncbi:flavin monoamine oxidase family protein [Spiribacter insolitus]|uniref:FAD-dependent oxidoreductase n=1 Tax=Spiribacter insolitus TaxID=3122417 RepID=A0ABV3T560_9GAMM